MVEILNFKNGAKVIKLNATVTKVIVRGILISHCVRDKDTEYVYLTWSIIKILVAFRYIFLIA
jgi:hypothetical protein